MSVAIDCGMLRDGRGGVCRCAPQWNRRRQRVGELQRRTESVVDIWLRRFWVDASLTGMKRLLLVPTVLLAGCIASGIMESEGGGNSSRFDPAQRLSPTAFEQNATMKDTSVHEDPNLLRAGVSRSQIVDAFGAPNETSDQGGQVQDVYEFNPDGSKFVKAESLCAQYRSRRFHRRYRDRGASGEDPSYGAAAYGVSARVRTRRDCAVGAKRIARAGAGSRGV